MADPNEDLDEAGELEALLGAELDKGGEPEPAPDSPERIRDDQGRFAKAQAEKEAREAPSEATAAQEQPAKPVDAPALAAPGTDTPAPEADQDAPRPPPGWSPSAKVAFDNLPPEVKEAVAKREVEVNNGFAKLAQYKPIDRFMDLAVQSGTTLDRALENFVGIENELRRDFVGGITGLCQRQGISPVELARVILQRSGMPSNQDEGEQQTNGHQQPQFDIPPDHPVMRDLAELKQHIALQKQQLEEQRLYEVQNEIQSFRSNTKEYPFFTNVEMEMGRLIRGELADNIKDAYDKACWANPEIRSLLIKQQYTPAAASKATAANQARAAAKSITGTPLTGARSQEPDETIEDVVREAYFASSA